MMNMLDPVVLFFLLGWLGGWVKSGLKIPDSFYNVLSIYLLLSIGIKGGIELFHADPGQLMIPAVATLLLSLGVCSIALLYLRKVGRFSLEDACAMAAHYGSVSAVTFAVVITWLKDRKMPYEEYVTVLLVLMEVPAIAYSILLYRSMQLKKSSSPGKLSLVFQEVLLGKSMILLVGGLLIGMFTAWQHNDQLNTFFFGMFKGFLAIFMLEMGVVTSGRIQDLRKTGLFLIVFGVTMPLISASLGVLAGYLAGMSEGGTVILATLAASASYIAAPAAIRVAIPEANPSYYLTAPLGITFPFNITFGIPAYASLTHFVFNLG